MKDIYIKSKTEPTAIWVVDKETGKHEPKFVYFPEEGKMIDYLDMEIGLVKEDNSNE